MSNDILYWVWLACRLGAGTRRVNSLLERFGSVFEIYRADDEAIMSVSSSSNDKLHRLSDKNLTEATKIIRDCERLGVDIIPLTDERYPARLRSIQNPPTVLYCRGILPNFDKLLCVGVVGTRKMSEYGCRAAYKISYGLASAGAVTVSGLALGVDGVVAGSTLAAGGHTVAVLGCGIDVVYPAKHRILYNELLSHGTIISEYPPMTRPTQYTFPQRNRIISGLSQGTFVVEGDFNSGALITARDALVQGRDLFALPGNVGEANSNGTNALIRDGANPVICAADILKEYLPLYRDVIDIKQLEMSGTKVEYDRRVLSRYGILPEFDKTVIPAEKPIKRAAEKNVTPQIKAVENHDDDSVRVYESLEPSLRAVYDRLPQKGAVSADMLTGDGINIGEVIAALTLLELRGLVEGLPGGLYSRK